MAKQLFKRPDGSFVRVDEAYVKTAVAEGMQPASEEQLQASRSPVRAFAEGAARTATLGLSDVFLKAASDDTGAMAARRAENPIAATTGEIAGYIPMAVGTGGAGAGASLSRVAAREAVVSGLSGLGGSISEAALENKDLTAESVASHMMTGAVLGGGLSAGTGLAMKGLSKGASALIKKAGASSFNEVLENAASAIEQGQLAKGNLAGVKKLIRKGGSLKEVVDFARQEGVPVEFSARALQAAEGALAKTHEVTAGLVSKLDDVTPLAVKETREGFVDSIEARLRERFKGNIAAEEDVSNFISKELAPLRSREDLTFKDLYKFQSELRKKVGEPAGVQSLKKEVYDIGRKELRDAIFTQAEAAGVAGAGELAGLQAQYAKGKFLKDTIENRLLKEEAASTFAMGDLLKGAVLGSGDPVTGMLGVLGAKYAREKGPGLAVGALRALSGSKTLQGVGGALGRHINQILSVAPEALGPFKLRLLEAASHGPDALLKEHVALARGAYGNDYLGRIGLSNETPEEANAAMSRLAILDSLQAAEAEKQVMLSSAIDGMFKAQKGSLKHTPMSVDDFMAARASIKNVLRDPTKAFESIPSDVNAAAPGTANQAVTTMLRAAQFLDSKMPKNPYEGMPGSVAQQWKPSAVDIDRFNRYKQAVETPEQVLTNMSKGYVSPEQVDVLKNVYPALYEDLRQKISERLMAQQTPVTYRQKLAFGMILGPGAASMSQQQVQILQQSTTALSSPNQGGMPKPDGRQSVNQEKNYQTQAQRLEGR